MIVSTDLPHVARQLECSDRSSIFKVTQSPPFNPISGKGSPPRCNLGMQMHGATVSLLYYPMFDTVEKFPARLVL